MSDASAEASDDPLGPDPDGPDVEVHGAATPQGGPAASTDRPHSDRSSVEELIGDLERTLAEREEFREALQRNQAEFENYRKRVQRQQAEDAARATSVLVEKLLAVLDACDGAVRHGATEVEPIYAALLGTLEKEGLERIDPTGAPFDPTRHEAVMHEPAADDGDDDGTVVSDVMRPGYAWNGRVVRPAMVKVRG